MSAGNTIVGGAGGVFLVPAYGKGPNFLVSEGNGYISREELTVAKPASGSGRYPEGMVMQITNDKFVPYTSGDAAGILYENVDVTENDVRVTVICRHAEVQRAMLFFASGVTNTQKNKAYDDLATAAITMR